jgi:hypothetical protein
MGKRVLMVSWLPASAEAETFKKVPGLKVKRLKTLSSFKHGGGWFFWLFGVSLLNGALIYLGADQVILFCLGIIMSLISFY